MVTYKGILSASKVSETNRQKNTTQYESATRQHSDMGSPYLSIRLEVLWETKQRECP